MIVVSNTSPIINLTAISRLDLINQLFGKITIPSAVYHEIAIVGAGEPGSTEVQATDRFSVHTVRNELLVRSLRTQLDAGEAEAIACALEAKASLLLIDERRGRAVAQQLGLQILGLLGLLVEAKRQQLLKVVGPEIDKLKTVAGFWISAPLQKRILDAAGENNIQSNKPLQ